MHAQKIGSGQRSRFLVLTKKNAASSHESAFPSVSDEESQNKIGASGVYVELNRQFAPEKC